MITVKKIKNYFATKAEEHRQRQLNRESVCCPYCELLYRPNQISDDTLSTKDIDHKRGSMKSQSLSFLRCRQCGKIFGVESNGYRETCTHIKTAFKIE